MIILISCALPSEFNEARNQIGLKEITTKKDRPRIAIKDNITLICTGIGKINSIISLQSAISELQIKPDIIIDTGTCGSLENKFKIFDIITSVDVVDFYNLETPGNCIKNRETKKIVELLPKLTIGIEVIASIEKNIVCELEREYLIKNRCNIVTWETSSIFSYCLKFNIPFISIRAVTDYCNDNTFKNFKENCTTACKKLYNYVKINCIGI